VEVSVVEGEVVVEGGGGGGSGGGGSGGSGGCCGGCIGGDGSGCAEVSADVGLCGCGSGGG
jgi:loricrin